MSKGFGGMPGNMQQMLKQAQKMQQDLAKAQEEAALLQEDGSAGGGAVVVTANGSNQLEKIVISPDAVDPSDVEMLQDMIMAACNEALRNVQQKVKEKISKVTGGMSLPGM